MILVRATSDRGELNSFVEALLMACGNNKVSRSALRTGPTPQGVPRSLVKRDASPRELQKQIQSTNSAMSTAKSKIGSARTRDQIRAQLGHAKTALSDARRAGVGRRQLRDLEREYAALESLASRSASRLDTEETIQSQRSETIRGDVSYDRLAPMNLGTRTLVRPHLSADPSIDDRARSWEDAYRDSVADDREIVRVDMSNGFTYSYDSTPPSDMSEPANRLIAVWGRSGSSGGPREDNRLRNFPDVRRKGERVLDKGHAAAHRLGGGEDINIIPQDRILNRGHKDKERIWSDPERTWTSIETNLAKHPGTPFFVRAIYRDNTDFPVALEYGTQFTDGNWEVTRFDNR